MLSLLLSCWWWLAWRGNEPHPSSLPRCTHAIKVLCMYHKCTCSPNCTEKTINIWTYHEISSTSNRHGTTQGIKNPLKKVEHGPPRQCRWKGGNGDPSASISDLICSGAAANSNGTRSPTIHTHPNRPRYGSTGKWGISGFGTLKHQPTWWFQLFSWQDYRIATPPAHKKSCCLMKQNIYTKRCIMDILISSLICSLFPHHWGAEKPL